MELIEGKQYRIRCTEDTKWNRFYPRKHQVDGEIFTYEGTEPGGTICIRKDVTWWYFSLGMLEFLPINCNLNKEL